MRCGLLGLVVLSAVTTAQDGAWSRPQEIPNRKTGAPPAVTTTGKFLHLVYRGKKKRDLYHSVYDGTRWSAETKLHGQTRTRPALAMVGNTLHLLHLGNRTLNLYHATYSGGMWSGWSEVPRGKSREGPALAAVGDTVHMVHAGNRTDRYYHSVKDDMNTIQLDNMVEVIRALAVMTEPIVSGRETPSRIDPSKLKPNQ